MKLLISWDNKELCPKIPAQFLQFSTVDRREEYRTFFHLQIENILLSIETNFIIISLIT